MQPCFTKKFTSWLIISQIRFSLKGGGERNHHVIDSRHITKQCYQKGQDGLMVNNLDIINVL